MQKIVKKTDGRTEVFMSVDPRSIFSEDFRAIARSILFGNLLKEFQEGSVAGVNPGARGFAQTTEEISEMVSRAQLLMLLELLDEVKQEDVFNQEMADLGFFSEDTNADDNTEKH